MAADGGQAANARGDAPKVRRGRKFDQVLAGARDVFMAHGFEGASVDDIARAAGVSKATLYSYFPDKRLLFSEVASCECTRLAAMAMDTIDMTASPAIVLEQIGRHFLDYITSDIGQSIFRICVAESDRFPDIGQQFYESGPMVLRAAMVDYLHGAAERGEVSIDDFELAAEQFGELCKADIWLRLTFNVSKSVTQAEIDRVIENAVATWLARFGT
ncbi:TetR/AcrR family transcriptional regulator [Primorskyibacter sp. S187A]|uniref:TetR/AcrR family transcriptional regulator n=1 Tax=Primorskyibacter sp. S187A TaxID=3415130 RepID=UPI003C7B0158